MIRTVSTLILLTGISLGAPVKPAATPKTTANISRADTGISTMFSGDFNSFKLTQYENSLNNAKNDYSGEGKKADATVKTNGVGFTVGASYRNHLGGQWSMNSTPFFQYAATGNSELNTTLEGQNDQGQKVKIDGHDETKVSMSLLGIRERVNYAVALAGNTFVPYFEIGIGHAWVKDVHNIKRETKVGDGKPDVLEQKPIFRGTKFAFELASGASYEFKNGFAPFVRAGYRFLKFDKLKAEDEYKKIDIKKNDPSKDLNDKTVAYDMGGFSASLGLAYNF